MFANLNLQINSLEIVNSTPHVWDLNNAHG